MLFNSFWYLVFLPTVVVLFWMSPRQFRTPLLLVASYVFYMSWKPVYGLLIFGMTLANYLFGAAIARTETKKKLWLTIAVAFNLVLLAVFKYTYFAWDMGNQAASWFGAHLPPVPWQIILPLGISFFVFEFIHYVTDVYKGSKPVSSFIDFALFASFFPTQIAGPIKRYQDFIPQLANDGRFDLSMLDKGMGLILFGLFKKVVFADNLAVVAQTAFSRPDLLTGVDLWIAVYAFAFQIYFDFSGYTDIARGSAWLLGYKVPPNFNLPYLANNITEFWHRWHISLSTWLRDYLFIPLGGSRGSKWFTWRNLMITMVLGGLWHGAALHFVVWGAYQGVMLILHKVWKQWSEGIAWLATAKRTSLFNAASIVVTFHFACVGWVFFRAETFENAIDIIKKLLYIDASMPVSVAAGHLPITIFNTTDPVIFMLLPFILAVLFAGQLLGGWLANRKEPVVVPIPLKAVYLTALVSLLLVFSPDTSPKFIYFQF